MCQSPFLTTKCQYQGVGGRSARWSAYISSNGKHPNCHSDQLADIWGVDLPGDLPIWALMVNIWNCHSDQLADLWRGRSARRSARSPLTISFYNITYYTWQIWALIVDICNCHVGGVLGCWSCQGGLHLIWLYNANWLFTNLIIQK